ncbi:MULTISPECIES: hypothetical protein [unclassified Bradyrhizobium]|jgi:hypothetical protein|uniref:hypothetical protein n=1 Tax=unclassified Bradyrhizobium TaxID=2631580 RepID=UPI0014048DC5|nr:MULTISPECIES: hypothetical protein [unclassified Bradyrhizobium]
MGTPNNRKAATQNNMPMKTSTNGFDFIRQWDRTFRPVLSNTPSIKNANDAQDDFGHRH